MDPKVWGPSGWIFLHHITLGYPDKPTDVDKQNMKNCFYFVGKVLPCSKCRSNYNEHVSRFPLDNKALSSRENLVKWLIDIHNEVNKKTNKPVLSYEDAIENFMVSNEQGYNIYVILLIVLIIIIILLIPYVVSRIWK